MRRFIGIFLSLIIIFSVCSLYSESIKELLKRAQKLEKEQNYDDAVEVYNKIIDKDSTNKEAILNRGFNLILIGEYESAVTNFDLLISIDSLNPDAYNARGLAKSYTDSIYNSLPDFNKAIELDSNFAQAYNNRANYWIFIKDFTSANKDLEKAKSLQPNNPSVYFSLANIQYKDNKLDDAIVNYTKAIDLGYNKAEVYYKRGNSYYKSGKFENSISDYTQAINLDSIYYDAYGNRAMAYQNTNKLDSAALDRKFLADKNEMIKKANDDGIDLNSLHYVFYPDSCIGMQIPDKFNIMYSSDTLANTIFFTLEKLNGPNDPYSIGGFIEINQNTNLNIGISDPPLLIDYWKGITTKEFDNYFKSEPVFTKTKPWGTKWSAVYTKNIITRTVKEQRLIYYNYGLAANGVLVNVHFQIPESMIWKYEGFFDKMINTISAK